MTANDYLPQKAQRSGHVVALCGYYHLQPERVMNFLLTVILALFMACSMVLPAWADETPQAQEIRVPFENLSESIDQAILKEKELATKYARELVKEQERIYTSELSAMKVQFSVYSNLVIMPETQVKSLEQAFAGNLSVLTTIQSARASLKADRDRVSVLLAQTEDQIVLNSGQLKQIRSDRKNQAKDSLKIIDKLTELLAILSKKKEALVKLESFYADFAARYEDMGKQFASLSGSFEREIAKRIKKNLLTRKKNPLFTKTAKDVLADLKAIGTLPRTAFTGEFRGRFFGQSETRNDASGLVILGLLFIFLQYFIFKGYRWFKTLSSRNFAQNSGWASLVVSLSERSLFLAANLLFISICDYFFYIRLKYPMVEMAEQVLTVILLTRWCLDALKGLPLAGEGFSSEKLTGLLKGLVRMIRYMALAYVLCAWLIEPDNVLFPVLRMVFTFLLYLELVRLRYIMVSCASKSSLPTGRKNVLCTLPQFGYGLLFAGLILDLSGYAPLAMFLLVSMGKTLIAGLWSGLIFKMLMDYKQAGQAKSDVPADDVGPQPVNTQWFFTLGYFLAWLTGSLAGVIYVWGGKQAVIQGIYSWYTTPLKVGSMQFSLMGFSIALAFLVLTHILARGWRELFQKRLLLGSGMDIGVQESITTISVYLIWTAGILMALNVFGLNMTSITVVLGALGIGIGFGLQNIFNNFLSGIILLFERPIQVGDDVEINGTWANVRKINVRSTVVQTYDNATLIIPNSDFISTQVTNWSFKDKRIRRSVTVGVAYGSDLELVRASLLESAEKTSRVLKLPKPDVIFRDFGDNSLVFVLRFWTRVEYFLSVESAVRFEIDRLFRERNIEISFPQRDLHIRSLDSDLLFRHADISKK